jgi:hypothetical protein
MQEDAVKKLISSLKCSSCGKNYQEAGIDVIEHREEVWFLKVLCPSCHAGSLVAAIIKDADRPVVTDLTAAEIEKFRQSGAIGENDLLEMHAFLRDFRGDLTGLLG